MIIWLVFTAILGTCIGSFLNVVVYRLPEGRSLVNPPSACPKCEHKLAWYDNVPVLGWLWLRGKCRYCKNPISPQYPIVEAATALLFGGWYAVCYMTDLRPGYGALPAGDTAMIFIISLLLIAALIAATVIDARLYIIPLQIPWLITALAIVLIPLSVAMFPVSLRNVTLPPAQVGNRMVLPQIRLGKVHEAQRGAASVRTAILRGAPGPAVVTAAPYLGKTGVRAAIAGAVGLLIAIILLWRGILKTSFAPSSDEESEEEPPLEAHDENLPQLFILLGPIVGVAVFSAAHAETWSDTMPIPFGPMIQGAIAGYGVVAAIMFIAAAWHKHKAIDPVDATDEQDDGVVFEPHPHTRREIMKEVLFLSLPIAGLILSGFVSFAPGPEWPAWVHALGGVLMGYLIGGGVVWAIRILGSLLFGKEAMGLGDVHLMGAVGAVCGWEVAVAAFFMAAFLGVAHAVLSLGLGSMMRIRGRQMPFGPQLAGATLIAMIWREPIATYFATVV